MFSKNLRMKKKIFSKILFSKRSIKIKSINKCSLSKGTLLLVSTTLFGIGFASANKQNELIVQDQIKQEANEREDMINQTKEGNEKKNAINQAENENLSEIERRDISKEKQRFWFHLIFENPKMFIATTSGILSIILEIGASITSLFIPRYIGKLIKSLSMASPDLQAIDQLLILLSLIGLEGILSYLSFAHISIFTSRLTENLRCKIFGEPKISISF